MNDLEILRQFAPGGFISVPPQPNAAPAPAPTSPDLDIMRQMAPQGFIGQQNGGTPIVPPGQAVGPQSFGDLFTGSQRTEFRNAPEYGGRSSAASGLGTTFRQMTVSDPEQMVGIIRRQYPEALFTRDRFGNLMVKVTPDAPAEYLNKPGFSAADAMRAVPDVAAAALSRGRSLTTRMATAGLAAGATSVGLDVAASAQGSETGIDPWRALTSTVVGAAGEGVASSVGRLASTWLANLRGRGNLLDNAGNLTTTGRTMLQQAGVEPDTLTREQLQQVQQFVRSVPEGQRQDAARLITERLRTNEFDIPLTRGQQTGDVTLEGRARAGQLGESATNQITGFDARQRDAVANAASGLQRRSGPGSPIPDEATAGSIMRDEVRSAEQAGRQRVTQAFDAVGNLNPTVGAGRQIMFPSNTVDSLRLRVSSATNDIIIDPTVTPGAALIMNRFRTLGENGEDVSLGQLNLLRRQILSTNGRDATERMALARMREQLDDWSADMVTNGLARGDEAVFEAYRNALRTNREFNLLFNPADAPRRVQGILDKAVAENYTGQELINALYGAGRLGSGEGSAAAITHFRTMFPPDSPIFGAMREGLLLRVLGTDIPSSAAQVRKMANNLDDALTGRGREIVEGLFTPEQINELRRFAGVLTQIAERSPGTGLAGAYRAGLTDIAGRVGAAGVAEVVGRASGIPGIGAVAGLLAGGGLANVVGGARIATATSGREVSLPLVQTPVSNLVSLSLGATRQPQADQAEPTVRAGAGVLQGAAQTGVSGLFEAMDRPR